MKSNRMKFITVALVITVLGAAIGLAETARHGHWRGGPDAFGGPFGGHALRFMSHYLDLTSDQQAQMKQIMQNEKPNFKPLIQQLAQSRQQARQIAEAGTFDESQAQAYANQQAQIMAQLTVQKLKTANEMYKVLTPDQQTKLNDFLDKREQRMHQRFNQQQGPSTQQPSNQ